MLKPGRHAIDPHGRVVMIVKVTEDLISVRLHGSYGATVVYPRSCLTPVTKSLVFGDYDD